MTFPQLRKLITKAKKEAEDRALELGIDVTEEEFKGKLTLIEQLIVEKSGFTWEEYEEYVESIKQIGKDKARAKEEKLEERLQTLKAETKAETVEEIKPLIPPKATYGSLPDKPVILSEDVIGKMIMSAINKIPKEERVVNITNPVIEKERVVERVVQDAKVVAELNRRIDELKIPEAIDENAIKEDLKGYFGEMFEHNIDIMNMPDFRKLAMGLQAQIDNVASSQTPLTPVGDVTGANGTFTVTKTPKYIVSDSNTYFEGAGYSISGNTVTMEVPPSQYIRYFI